MDQTDVLAEARIDLILVGASVRAAAQLAVRAGFRPWCIDLFGDADLRAIAPVRTIERYPVEFLTALRDGPQVPWMYTGGLENYPRLIGRMAKLRPLLGNGPEVLQRVRNPEWLANVLAEAPIRFPRTVRNLGGAPPAGTWLSKPLRSAGGMGIRQVDQRDGADASDTNRRRQRKVWQEPIAGEPLSAALIARDQAVELLGTSQQWIGERWSAPSPYQYAGGLSPARLTGEETAAILATAELIARKSELRGLFGLDLIRSEWGLSLCEVNPRLTASMELLEVIDSQDLIGDHWGCFKTRENETRVLSKVVQAGGLSSEALRRVVEPLTTSGYRAKLIVYATSGGLAGKMWQATADALAGESDTYQLAVADRPLPGSLMTASSPICTLLTAGPDAQRVEERLRQAADQLRQALSPLPANQPRASPT
jgi:predicted ATP-grasp superfamily ATP-dependent carboligase